ncbi:OLC1v1037100C1 [Oldenlandia corymbosa var. corymbosa]|uniref:OLC1v1037100C1 n=1 Tax=Oldenlandia corymbosa var. corymbosa TaxID=529605 RepID=A0AAV1CXM5_OLDCO|nr:OLC1v1037100C1 [Oldenlandia corymbosa var. corymbosa]
MDGNKDEALKCLEIAKHSLQSGDKIRALKFLRKARRLFPSIEIDDQLSELDSSGPAEATDESASKPFAPLDSGPRRRTSANGPAASSSSSSAAYTEEQVTIVREIKRKKDYYEILGLEKSCSVEDVKKAYRKLSLKVHPDKNKAPGAEEVFKMVSKAFQCLSNEESRKKYDLVGSDEAVYETQTQSRAYRRGGVQGFNGFYYDGDFDADEIFRNFFYGGMHPATTTQFGGFSFGPGGVGVRMGGNHGSNGGMLRTLIQVLPVILILLVNFLPSQQPIYSLSRSYPYEYRMTTEKGVNYYVKSEKFAQEYPPNSRERVAFERQVEGDYHRTLSHYCRIEIQNLHWGYKRETPNCDALKQFEAARG